MDPKTISLDDKYTATSGRVYLTGIQALVRLPISQHLRDVEAGLNTAGYISGYRGSPLSGYDTEIFKAKTILDPNNIFFDPGLNEELGATAVWGSQQAGIFGKPKFDGVHAIWYAKNPGLDRAGDALKHGNFNGSAKLGGVLAVVGDDHAAKSATMPNQGDFAFMSFGMPILYPSNVQEVIDFGLYGWAMSRFSGCWIGFKVLPQLMDASASVSIRSGAGEDRAARVQLPARRGEHPLAGRSVQPRGAVAGLQIAGGAGLCAGQQGRPGGLRPPTQRNNWQKIRHRHRRQVVPGRAAGAGRAGHR